MFKKTKKGFTIVELVIVIAVIGILSAILIPTFANLTTQAQQTALRSNLASAYSMYASEAADHEVKSVSSSVEVKVADIEFVGQDKVFLVEKSATTTTEGYIYDGAKNEWKIEKVAFGASGLSGDQTFVAGGADDAAKKSNSTFGDYVFYYAK